MRVVEIFDSINGEVTGWHQGSLTTFIRLAGCNLRCSYCDAQHAQSEKAGREMTVGEVCSFIHSTNVTITGGEPLLQPIGLQRLVYFLIDHGFHITIETNGTIDPCVIDSWNSSAISWVVDYKPPQGDFYWEEMKQCLVEKDWIKFVITDRKQYEHARKMVSMIREQNKLVSLAFSPCMPGEVSAKQLMDWMIEDRLWSVLLNVQLHKIIGVE